MRAGGAQQDGTYCDTRAQEGMQAATTDKTTNMLGAVRYCTQHIACGRVRVHVCERVCAMGGWQEEHQQQAACATAQDGARATLIALLLIYCCELMRRRGEGE